jgi:hypothetical protein
VVRFRRSARRSNINEIVTQGKGGSRKRRFEQEFPLISFGTPDE